MPKADQELIITLKKGTKPKKSFHALKHFTVGSDYASDLAVQGANVPSTLLEFKRVGQVGKERYTLSFAELTPNITGEVTKADTTVSLGDLTRLGLLKEHKGRHTIELRPGFEGTVTLAAKGGSEDKATVIGFSFQRLTQARKVIKPAVKIPHMSLFTGNELVFSILLIASLLLHVASVKYLETVEITVATDIEEIKKMEPRFARLILKPKKRERIKASVIEIKEDEPKVEEVKEEPPPKKKDTPEKTKDKADAKPTPKPTPTAATQEASAGTEEIRKRDLRKRVKKKGVLGIISSKESLLGTVKRDQVWRDVDSIIATAEYGSDKGETLAGVGGTQEVTRATGLVKADAPRARSRSEIIQDKQSSASFDTGDTGKGDTFRETPGPGGREEGEVYGVVKRYVGGLKYLYNKALRKDSSLRGLVTVRIIIDSGGKVRDVQIVKSTLASEPLLDSIKSRIYLWRFKDMPKAPDFTIDYTFDFSPVG